MKHKKKTTPQCCTKCLASSTDINQKNRAARTGPSKPQFRVQLHGADLLLKGRQHAPREGKQGKEGKEGKAVERCQCSTLVKYPSQVANTHRNICTRSTVTSPLTAASDTCREQKKVVRCRQSGKYPMRFAIPPQWPLPRYAEITGSHYVQNSGRPSPALQSTIAVAGSH